MPIRWQCPVAVSGRSYTAKSDVYSFGVLVWEIFSGGGTPFAELTATEVLAAVRAGHRLTRPSPTTSETVVALIRQCTTMEVNARPSMVEVQHRLTPVVMNGFEEDYEEESAL